jgi:NitT/TauT family transport system substrate-binding protein
MQLRIMVSRHSAFYSPLIAAIAAGFLEEAGITATYGILEAGQRSQDLIRNGVADVIQSAVSSNWKPMDRGESPLPVHFALINRRDGFFLAGRQRDDAFTWRSLEGKTLLADHGAQPLAMLRYAVHYNGADWTKIHVIDRASPEEMADAFRRGEGDYVHLQAPGPQLLEERGVGWTVVSVGASMPEVAFSTLCCSREFTAAEAFRTFLRVYSRSREWVRTAPPANVAEREASFFPGIGGHALSEAIARYQTIGCWDGTIGITPELYEQALNVFEYSGGLAVRHPAADVLAKVPFAPFTADSGR